jgi:hypothetical protein
MRPDQCGVIATPRFHSYKEGEETKLLNYLHLTEYGRPMSGQVLWWFVEKFLSGDIPNLLINMEGGYHRLGVPEFYRADL